MRAPFKKTGVITQKGVVSPLIDFFTTNGFAQPFASEEGLDSEEVFLTFNTTNLLPGVPIYFDSNSKLNGKNSIITEIEVVDSVTQGNNINPARDNLTLAQMSRGLLVLADANHKEILTMPLWTLVRRLNAGKPTFFNVKQQLWQNCYLWFSDLTTISSTTNALNLRICTVPNKKI